MRRILATIAVVIVVAIAIVMIWRSRQRPDIPIARATVGRFVISIKRTGEVKAKRSVTITAPSTGEKLIITYLIPEGSFVKKGDLLVQFDPTELVSRLESAKRDLAAAQAELELTRAKNELRRRELAEEIRKKEVELKRAEGSSPVDIENARAELELAKAKAETEMKLMEAEVVKSEVQLERAKERVASAEKSLQELTVLAPGDGLVIHEKVWRGGQQVKVQEGDSPWPMQPILSLPDLSTLYVATDVDEADISRISPGQRCLITLEAYPDTSFTGEIERIGNLARPRYYTGGPNVFDVWVKLDSIDERLRPGMKTKVEIIIDEADSVISVPIEAVFEEDGAPIVYVKQGGGFRRRQIKVGKRNDTHIIVEAGLEGGEEVALVKPEPTGEG